MIKLFRRRPADVQSVTLRDSCGQVRTPTCFAEARAERTRTAALTSHPIR